MNEFPEEPLFPDRRQILLETARFYGIVDLGYLENKDPIAVTKAMIQGGVEVIQLRGKKAGADYLQKIAYQMRELIPSDEILFFINDYPGLARDCKADGVHIGQEDGVVHAARALLTTGQLVGKSTHSLEQAIAAAAEKPDYIAVGPLFATLTKPDYMPVGLDLIRLVREKVDLPRFCIGGINEKTLPSVLAAGADRIVIVSDLLQSDDIVAYCERIKARLGASAI